MKGIHASRPIEQVLSIGLITYNRASKLDAVLRTLAGSVLRDCSITVYDNASSDTTPAVVQAHKADLVALKYIRRPINIGACANLAIAYAEASEEYFWLLCDDDDLDPAGLARVARVLEEGVVDLVLLNALNLEGFDAGFRGSLEELRRRRWRYYWQMSFLPSAIYRTEFISSDVIRGMFRNNAYYFPHATLIAAACATTRRVQVFGPDVLRRHDSGDIGINWLAYTYGWVRATAEIPNRHERCLAFTHRFSPQEKWWRMTLKSAAYVYAFKDVSRWEILRMWSDLPAYARFLCCPIGLITFVPRSWLRVAGRRMKPEVFQDESGRVKSRSY